MIGSTVNQFYSLFWTRNDIQTLKNSKTRRTKVDKVPPVSRPEQTSPEQTLVTKT